VFLQVLAAVSHAHGKLILHRDLKPTNILVSAEGRVKLLDFGIAKLLHDEGAAAAAELTQRAFTPEYAAPEQVQGAEATMATDVYALGVLLWVLLVGEHPTARVQGTAVQRLQALVEAEAGLASERARRVAAEVARARGVGTGEQLARQLRGDLDNIVGKALKKAPGERYATVQALADDLQRYLDHEPVSARADSAAYRVAKFVRRHRIGVGAATAITLALVAGVAGTAWQAVEARRAQARAEANERDARRQRAAAEFEARVARANHEFLSQVFGDAMRGGESDRMRQRLDRALEMVRRRYADDPQIHAILLMQVSGRYAELGDDKRAAEVMQEIEAIAARTQDRALSASVECIRAYDLLIEGRRDEAAPFIARGLALMDGAEDVQSAAAFECLRADAMLAALKRDLVRARARMGELLALLESNGRARTRAYRSALGSLAYVDHLGDDPAAALAVSRRAIVLDEQLGTADTINGAVEFDRQAGLLAELGRMTEALQSDAQLRGRFAAAGEALPMGMRVSTARRALLGGRTQEAVATLREAVAFYAKDGPEIYARGTLLDLADALWMLGRPAQATLQLQQYERRLAKAPEGANEGTEAARLRALLALDRGDRAAAHAQVDDLLARLDSRPDAKRRVHLKARLAAGWVLLRFGETDAARRQADLARALAEGLRLDGQTSAWAGAAHLLAARIAQAAGDAAAAERALNEARRQLADTVDPAHPLRAAAGHTAPH
jgi:serine/threonine-protein kinase